MADGAAAAPPHVRSRARSEGAVTDVQRVERDFDLDPVVQHAQRQQLQSRPSVSARSSHSFPIFRTATVPTFSRRMAFPSL